MGENLFEYLHVLHIYTFSYLSSNYDYSFRLLCFRIWKLFLRNSFSTTYLVWLSRHLNSCCFQLNAFNVLVARWLANADWYIYQRLENISETRVAEASRESDILVNCTKLLCCLLLPGRISAYSYWHASRVKCVAAGSRFFCRPMVPLFIAIDLYW